MKIELPLYGYGKTEIKFDARRQSLLISFLEHDNYVDAVIKREEAKHKLLSLYHEMIPSYLVTVRWITGVGYETFEFHGVSALGCKTIQLWKPDGNSHLEIRRNPFERLPSYRVAEIYTFKPDRKEVMYEESDYLPEDLDDYCKPLTASGVICCLDQLIEKDENRLEELIKKEDDLIENKLGFKKIYKPKTNSLFDSYGMCLNEEFSFKMAGGKNSKEFKKQIKENKPFVDKFCDVMGTELLDIGVTMEDRCFEPIYFFSDNLGYYTIRGIKNSLK